MVSKYPTTLFHFLIGLYMNDVSNQGCPKNGGLSLEFLKTPKKGPKPRALFLSLRGSGQRRPDPTPAAGPAESPGVGVVEGVGWAFMFVGIFFQTRRNLKEYLAFLPHWQLTGPGTFRRICGRNRKLAKPRKPVWADRISWSWLQPQGCQLWPLGGVFSQGSVLKVGFLTKAKFNTKDTRGHIHVRGIGAPIVQFA